MPGSTSKKRKMKFNRDRVVVIETNVDDVTGEVISHAIDRLIEEGALDATATTFLGKKGRLGQTVRVTALPNSVESLAQILVEETGTLGVKTTEFERLIVPRKTLSIPFQLQRYKGKVQVKFAKINESIRIKPEFSTARSISEKTGVPLREVIELISESARKRLEL
jgi:pyridinium-3,5-bisthiocarboxylic acid mononucleotide nickel chelatase